MATEEEIRALVKDGIITRAQAQKILSRRSTTAQNETAPRQRSPEQDEQREPEGRTSRFVAIVAIIGAILIFVGFAWLIAKNWHQIPDLIKIFILISVTSAAFVSGVISRQKGHEGVGRALLVLGALLYILSLFLIAEIYSLATTEQHYAWILLLAWTLIILSAYLLDSPENLVVSLLVFFQWLFIQYVSSISNVGYIPSEGIAFAFILISLSAGILLYGLSMLHNSIRHRFTGIYRFWTAFYFLLIFYLLSFQSLLPLVSEWAFEGKAFSGFLVFFIVVSVLGFAGALLYAVSRNPASVKELLVFIGIIAVLFLLIVSTKIGTGTVGWCYPKSCYEFSTPSECASAPEEMVCGWAPQPSGPGLGIRDDTGRCEVVRCYHFTTEAECESNLYSEKIDCFWQAADPTAVTTEEVTPEEHPQGYCKEGIDYAKIDLWCSKFTTEAECESSPYSEKIGCVWQPEQISYVDDPYKPGEHITGYCEPDKLDTDNEGHNRLYFYEGCMQHNNDKESCIANDMCKWRPEIFNSGLSTSLWIMWIINNFVFIGFIILVLWYGQVVGSTKIVNLALLAFILEIISRYIGFWMDLRGYFMFSLLAIIGGLMLIIGAWKIPKWRKKLLDRTVMQQRDGLKR